MWRSAELRTQGEAGRELLTSIFPPKDNTADHGGGEEFQDPADSVNSLWQRQREILQLSPLFQNQDTAWGSFLTEETVGKYVALIPCIAAGRKKASSSAGVEHKSQGRTAGSPAGAGPPSGLMRLGTHL